MQPCFAYSSKYVNCHICLYIMFVSLIKETQKILWFVEERGKRKDVSICFSVLKYFVFSLKSKPSTWNFMAHYLLYNTMWRNFGEYLEVACFSIHSWKPDHGVFRGTCHRSWRKLSPSHQQAISWEGITLQTTFIVTHSFLCCLKDLHSCEIVCSTVSKNVTSCRTVIFYRQNNLCCFGVLSYMYKKTHKIIYLKAHGLKYIFVFRKCKKVHK